MGALLLPFLVLQLFYLTSLNEVLSSPLNAVNSINDKLNDYSVLLPPEPINDINDVYEEEDSFADSFDLNDGEDVPIVQTFDDKTELTFRLPIESVNIDYLRNAVILKFHKHNAKSFVKLAKMEDEKKKSAQDNFMRFGKRSYEEYPSTNSLLKGLDDENHGLRLERSHQTARDARGDNFMRFGRAGNANNDFMRFGRSASQDFMRFGRSVGKDFMRFGRTPATKDFMRFGRTPSQDFMRFGRSPTQDFMRFGRTPSQDFMRFGRSPTQDFMRFGRAGQDDFMRFGRSPHTNFMRFGRHSFKLPKNTNFMRFSRPDNFMRFGRTPPQGDDNFMRFGKSIENTSDKNTSSSQHLMDKNELKQAVKLIHEADKNADNGNPVDKAIKVLFDKHQQQDATTTHNYELGDDENTERNENSDVDSDLDYLFKVSA